MLWRDPIIGQVGDGRSHDDDDDDVVVFCLWCWSLLELLVGVGVVWWRYS